MSPCPVHTVLKVRSLASRRLWRSVPAPLCAQQPGFAAGHVHSRLASCWLSAASLLRAVGRHEPAQGWLLASARPTPVLGRAWLSRTRLPRGTACCLRGRREAALFRDSLLTTRVSLPPPFFPSRSQSDSRIALAGARACLLLLVGPASGAEEGLMGSLEGPGRREPVPDADAPARPRRAVKPPEACVHPLRRAEAVSARRTAPGSSADACTRVAQLQG